MAEARFVVVALESGAADRVAGLVPADQAFRVLSPASDGGDPGALAIALREVITDGAVLLLDSDPVSRDVAGFLLARHDVQLVWGIDAVRIGPDGAVEADRVILGGSHRLVHRLDVGRPIIVLGKPTTTASERGGDLPETERIELPTQDNPVRLVEKADHRGASVPLAAARTIISVGRGIGGAPQVDTFRQLAEATGSALGASRVAVDAGWVPFAHQVGQTGTTVSPELYIAFGISGAVQHLAGMRSSKKVIAINTDVEAPMSQLADLVVRADACAVARALLARLATV